MDTGSGHTLIKEKAVRRIGEHINKRRNPPLLHGVTGAPLRILGMVSLTIKIGDNKVHQRWVPVVPDSYISCDVLLGCDVLTQGTLVWNGLAKILTWNGTPYKINHIPVKRRTVRSVQTTVSNKPNQGKNINLAHPVHLGPYQTQFFPLPCPEPPGQTLLVYPQPTISKQCQPYLIKVQENQTIYVPFFNTTKVQKIVRVGTIVGTYESIPDPPTSQIHAIQDIQNRLLPQGVDELEGESRIDRLQSLINQQSWEHLNQTQRQELEQVLLKHDPLFLLDPTELGKIDVPPVHIQVSDPTPSRGPIYRYPEVAKQQIATMLTEMEEKKVIERSTAAWLSPIILVAKPDGSKRMCLDYRHVNKHLATDIYPLPRLEELVEQASGHKVYATLDLKDAYFQIPLDSDSRDLTTFSDGVTLYRFVRLPQGLSCSPAIFSRTMASLLAPLIQEGWIRNYLDDLIIWAPSHSHLIERLEKLFQLLADKGVKLNLSKCKFGLPEITFLGHVISEKGSHPDPKNIEAITTMKPPKTVKEVRRFLGMCGFYRKYIPAFAKIATPLSNLTRTNTKFCWTTECEKSFDELKSCLIKAPVLARAQLDQPFILTTDASDTHVGAVLSQFHSSSENKPIAYFSKKLNPCEKRYSTTDKEALGITLACRQFHHFLWGTHFTIITDHQPLTSIFKRKTKCPRMNRWILEMREYNYNIQYLKGKYNVVADQLSRPVSLVVRAPDDMILGLTPSQFGELQIQEPVWREIVSFLKGKSTPPKHLPHLTLDQFAYKDDLLYFVKEQIDGSLLYTLIVPSPLRTRAMKHCHELSGHLGQKKTIKKTEELFFWPNLKVDVCNFVKRCVTCQRVKSNKGLQTQYQELPPVQAPLQRIGMDVTDMVGGNHGYRYILTIIDHYSRYVKFFPLPTKHTTHITQHLEEYIADYGTPQSIVLDNGGEFTSKEFQNFCHSHHITLYYTTPYHPQGNGITERMHRTLKSILAALCKGHPLRWPRLIRSCQTIMNQAVHTSTGTTPFFAFFSRHPPRLLSPRLPSTEGADDDITAAHKIIQDTHQKMTRKYRAAINRKRKNQAVEEGALVWVRSPTNIPGTSRKLNIKWTGPFRVLEKLRDGGAYVVENVFTSQRLQRAAEQIKPYYGSDGWLLEPAEEEIPEPEIELSELPPRTRRAPRRLIEEC